MDAILTLTLMHDRHLSAVSNTKLSTTEAYHWYQATGSFNKQLSRPLQVEQQAALLATAALLGTVTFCHIEARTPEEAWPLKQPSSSDLDWLRMSDGKKEVWKLTQPLKADPVFHALAAVHTNELLPTPSTRPEPKALPLEIISLYGLDATSTSDNNPYHAAATDLAQVLDIDHPITTILTFLSFISTIHPGYKRLLERKDPLALLLLACWYAKIYQLQVWWLQRRALLEGQAICTYLERHYRHEIKIQTLLKFPRTMFCPLSS
jgi:hypothetical protein